MDSHLGALMSSLFALRSSISSGDIHLMTSTEFELPHIVNSVPSPFTKPRTFTTPK